MKKGNEAQANQGAVNHSEIAECLLSCLTAREREVITRRYGLYGGEKETLEEIGRDHTITRERVRQIERASIAKIKRLQNYREELRDLVSEIDAIIARYGGIVAHHHLVQELLKKARLGSMDSELAKERNRLIFLLKEFVSETFHFKEEGDVHTSAWSSNKKQFETLEATLRRVEELFKEHGVPASEAHIAAKLGADPESVYAKLHLSKKIARNPFGMWGLRDWADISPRRMGDRIYLVLKTEGAPLHYREIAYRISKYYGKKAHAPTVHNELIADPRFVLVGRGLYGLAEAGYREGTVKDVVELVLEKAGGPLTREEVLERVWKERVVARSTILLALNNSDRIRKVGKDTYILRALFENRANRN